jgi:putative acetyltransferase
MAAARKGSGKGGGNPAAGKAGKKAARKTVRKAAPAKRTASKSKSVKKIASKQAATKKSVSRKAAVKKAAKRSAAVKKAAGKKTASKRKVGKKAASRNVASGKSRPARQVAKKPATRKAGSTKAAGKTAARKTAAKNIAARKPPAGSRSASRKAAPRKVPRKHAAAAGVSLPPGPAPLRRKAKTSQSRRKAKLSHAPLPASRRLAARTPVGRPSILVGMRSFNQAERMQLRDGYLASELLIREIVPADHAAVSELLLEAFSGTAEELLTRELRETGHLLCELVAEYDGVLAGYAAFSRISADIDGRAIAAAALAPLAVESALRGLGIARRLIVAGLADVRAVGTDAVFVLGDPDYYAQVGFSNAMGRRFASPYPAEHMSALEFSPGAAAGSKGKLVYPRPFDKL